MPAVANNANDASCQSEEPRVIDELSAKGKQMVIALFMAG